MRNDRFDIVRRKHLGKYKIKEYISLFIELGFAEYELIDLEQSEIIIRKLQDSLSEISPQTEMISEEAASFIESDLLIEVYKKLDNASLSYVFTDDFEVCGMFLVKAKQAIEQAMNIAKKDAANTCFVLDYDFKYYFRVNYYDKTHNDFTNTYDIQRVLKPNL